MDNQQGTPTPSQQTSDHAAVGPIHATGVQSMSLVPARDETLQRAIEEYISKLSDDDKAAFRSAPDIIERLETVQFNSRSPIPGSARVEKVLQCIKYFMSSLSIFIGHHPKISALVLGGVNCILTVRTNITP